MLPSRSLVLAAVPKKEPAGLTHDQLTALVRKQRTLYANALETLARALAIAGHTMFADAARGLAKTYGLEVRANDAVEPEPKLEFGSLSTQPLLSQDQLRTEIHSILLDHSTSELSAKQIQGKLSSSRWTRGDWYDAVHELHLQKKLSMSGHHKNRRYSLHREGPG